jgi:N,N-dimethylformamidase
MADKSIVGYCEPWSVRAGQTIAFKVSSEAAGAAKARLHKIVCADCEHEGLLDMPLVPEVEGIDFFASPQITRAGSYAYIAPNPILSAAHSFTFFAAISPWLLDRQQSVLEFNGVSFSLTKYGQLKAQFAEQILVSDLPLAAKLWQLVGVGIDVESGVFKLFHLPIETQLSSPWLPLEGGQKVLQLNLTSYQSLNHRFDGQLTLAKGFYGRVDTPTIVKGIVDSKVALTLLERPQDIRVLWQLDFGQGIKESLAVDVGSFNLPTQLINHPTRAVQGFRWDGQFHHWPHAPSHYSAAHFHADDMTNAHWETSFEFLIPHNLKSGIYCFRIQCEADDFDEVVFFVRPALMAIQSAVAFLVPSYSYQAYANAPSHMMAPAPAASEVAKANEAWLSQHQEIGKSLYELHDDTSGVHYSTRHRPILNVKPFNRAWQFVADTHLCAWFAKKGIEYDVLTDEDLHTEGVSALTTYRCVVTGSHPEYWSSPMMDGLKAYLQNGGHLMYLGGNGFYARIAVSSIDSGLVEARRAEGGTRPWISEAGEYALGFTGEMGGMWRRLGYAPNKIVGVGMAAQGFEKSTHYRVANDAWKSRVAWILKGIEGDKIGEQGLWGGGAAGQEVDRFDLTLGSPSHAIVLASSEGFGPDMALTHEELLSHTPLSFAVKPSKRARADIVYFETANSGAVFSVGSIAWIGALLINGGENNVSRVTLNVLREFANVIPSTPSRL